MSGTSPFTLKGRSGRCSERRGSEGGRALLAVFLGIAACSTLAASSNSSEQSGKMISVTVHAVDGERARGASVVVSALPVDGRDGDLMFEPIGNATANESGVARVSLDLRDVKRFLASDGSIDLRVSASDRSGSDSGSYNVPVYLRGHGLTTPYLKEDSLTADQGGEFTQFDSITLSLGPAKAQGLPADVEFTLDPNETPLPAALPFGACRFPDEHEILRATSYYSSKYLPVKRIETRSKSKANYEWSRSNDTKWTVATNGGNGGLASSASQTSAGFSYTAPQNANRRLEVHWQYRMYDIVCYNSMFGQIVRDTAKDEWRPNAWTGGTQPVTTTTTQFTCKGQRQTTMAANTWVTRSSTATYTNSATIAGVTLTQQQTGTSSTKLTVLPLSGQTAKICGDTAYPKDAKRIKEVP